MLKLKKLDNFLGGKGPLLFIVMDGIGLGKEYDLPATEIMEGQAGGNAVFKSKTPTLDKLFSSPLFTKLKAHGQAVGLPSEDDMGNSEVGHNALGAGRIFDQGAKLVNKSIESGKIFQSELWRDIIKRAEDGGTIHFIGLLSDGNVHSHIEQLFALIKRCAEEGVRKVRLHPLADGRDVPGRTVLNYIKPTEDLLNKINSEKGFDYRIASGGGRMKVTMDRYNADWNIVKRGWDAHVLGIGRKFKTAEDAVKTFYEEDPNIIDQYLDAFVVVDDNDEPIGKIVNGDSVIMFNFRGDRAIELSRAFEEKDFKEFDRVYYPDVLYAGMMEYDGDLHIPKNYLVFPSAIDRTISEYLCAEKVTSFAISETQKYGHVTYFWNGNRSGYIDESLEKYFEIPSDKIEFDKAPKMKAYEITEKTIELLRSNKFKWGRVNFANGDMVGHTGNFDAAVIAVEVVDECVGKLLKVIDELEGIAIVTADHGNADEMFIIKNGKKEIKTSHTLNPVPFVIYDTQYKGEYKMSEVKNPGLTNVAATILNLLGFEKVEDYDESLINF
ncbi:MAG: 2,3-bisphosphoglycerate-independent phosphoglycerate mutase [Ignavibacteria bacterium]|nr:2,3-bisphosphoglycerate-independent phosphoglycerate mutase [Ignavibacteria bacterium]